MESGEERERGSKREREGGRGGERQGEKESERQREREKEKERERERQRERERETEKETERQRERERVGFARSMNDINLCMCIYICIFMYTAQEWNKHTLAIHKQGQIPTF